MVILWLFCQMALIAWRFFLPMDYWKVSPFHMLGLTLLPTIAAFALIFLTASLLKVFFYSLRTRSGREISPTALVLAHLVGLGTLVAPFIFTYPVGFSVAARIAFIAFAVVMCGLLSAGRLAAE